MEMRRRQPDSDKRPSPEARLEAAQKEEVRTGRLGIFLGAAPGVGKTYVMLQTARARKRDGYDVVVGMVDTHGRRTRRPSWRASRSFLALAPRTRDDGSKQ